MLFDERPKTSREDLYNMEHQLDALVAALKRGDPMVLILGLRRTGKTSLLLTGLQQSKLPTLVLDLRAIGERPYSTKKELVELLEGSVNRFLAEQKGRAGRLLDRFSGIKGVQVMGTGVSFSWAGRGPIQIVDVFKLLDEVASRHKYKLIIAFDEAQELAKIAGFNMPKVLAYVYDHCRNTSVVLTGSAIGLLREFVSVDQPSAPLFGRAMTEISLGRLSEAQSRDFLEKGFRQSGIKLDSTLLNKAIARLDGIIGWLTLFGSVCTKQDASLSAIEKVADAGKAMARSEFQTFLGTRQIASKRYARIMKQLASGPASWSEVKRSVETLEGRAVNDRTITDLITALVKAGFVEKSGESYNIGDPLLAEAFR